MPNPNGEGHVFSTQEEIAHWKAWFDQFGFVSNKSPGVQTHNGIMFTAEYVFWLTRVRDLQQLPQGFYALEKERIGLLLASCYVPNGGYKRAPSGWTSYHLNQNDDYFGLAMISRLFGTDESLRAVQIMDNNWGCLNDQNPGQFTVKSNLGRMPQLRATLQLSAGIKPSPYGMVFWLAWLFFSLTRGNRDSVVKAWMASHAAYGFRPALDLVIKIYWYFLKKKITGIGAREYFPINHPTRLFMWDWI